MLANTTHSFSEVILHTVERHSFLTHRIAFTDGDSLIVLRVKVDGNAERSADFILTTVALANTLRIVEIDVPPPTQLVCEVTGDGTELLVTGQR